MSVWMISGAACWMGAKANRSLAAEGPHKGVECLLTALRLQSKQPSVNLSTISTQRCAAHEHCGASLLTLTFKKSVFFLQGVKVKRWIVTVIK